jgi:hypothetical protein
MSEFVRLPDGRLRRKYGGAAVQVDPTPADPVPADPVPAIYDPERQEPPAPEATVTPTSKKGKE